MQSVQEQRALEVAPRSVDPIPQTVATALQGYLNHPDVERKRAVEAIRFLNQPMLAVQVRDLRQAYKDFQRKGDVKTLLETVEGLREKFGGEEAVGQRKDTVTARPLGREDLRLICFDLVTGG